MRLGPDVNSSHLSYAYVLWKFCWHQEIPFNGLLLKLLLVKAELSTVGFQKLRHMREKHMIILLMVCLHWKIGYKMISFLVPHLTLNCSDFDWTIDHQGSSTSIFTRVTFPFRWLCGFGSPIYLKLEKNLAKSCFFLNIPILVHKSFWNLHETWQYACHVLHKIPEEFIDWHSCYGQGPFCDISIHILDDLDVSLKACSSWEILIIRYCIVCYYGINILCAWYTSLWDERPLSFVMCICPVIYVKLCTAPFYYTLYCHIS